MMTTAERAKQFAPFDAMKGLQEALRDREERHSRVERHEISEEQQEKNEDDGHQPQSLYVGRIALFRVSIRECF